ncbi:hypothetical protein [Nocardioides sp. TF02-7]|uniref:SCO6745 family protein n=1 Tax=Nocardioides sp. TF02-7 TaxID=2917724 RepID=UPI001F062200|nr:hypothetical protein [Nocardioides sp. TF02-7]UMG94397.1 hypothetical protein MF408_10665 [Nocardioides sp. TF02-7]
MSHPAGSPEGRSRRSAERALWRLVEAYHALVYYAPERPQVYTALGLKGGWMGYFATRSAALGVVPADVVTACFHGFAPRMVERALPDAWRWTTPEQAAAARLTVFDRAVRRHLGERVDAPVVAELASRLAGVVDVLPSAGAPLFAAHRSLPRPVEPHLTLFWATTALREFRGDAHVAALRTAGLGPAESNLLMAALGLVPHDQRTYRGWTEDEWAAAAATLTARGWLADDGSVTETGRRERAAIEDRTDAMTAPAWSRLGDDELAALTADLVAVAEPIVTSGGVPYPNGMGMAPAAEVAVAG